MRTALTLVVATLAAAAASAADAKAVRMKTARQLKEILADLDIDVPAGADKEALRALATEHDAITKYEAKHPEKKKKKPAPGAGGMPSGDAMGEMLFPMLDKDKDGKLSKEELMAMAQQAGGGGAKGKEETDNAFASMDVDGDGFVSKTEANAFFRSIAGMMGDGMGGGMPGRNETYPRKVADPSDAVEPMSSFSQLLQRRSAGPSLPTHANAEGVYPCARVDSRLSVRLVGLAVCALAAFALFSRVLYPSSEL